MKHLDLLYLRIKVKILSLYGMGIFGWGIS